MRVKHRSLVFALGLGLFALGGTAYAAQVDRSVLGWWTPVMELWGGEPDGALASLDQVTHALDVSIHHYEIDKTTQAFLDGVLEQLDDFDLDGLYDLLPDERNGGRELNVRGALVGDRYWVRRAPPGGSYLVGIHGPRSGFADMSLYVHAQQKEHNKDDALLLRVNAGLGLGPITYRALAAAQREGLRLLTEGPAASAASLPEKNHAREAVRATNPDLGEEDLDALALLFDAYPFVSRTLVNLGRVKDVRAPYEGDSFHITTRLKIEPKRMAARYPALATRARKLGDSMEATMRLVDARGRNLTKLKLNTDQLTMDVELYVADGLVLPFDDQHVYKNEPIDPLSSELWGARMLVEARTNMLGIVAQLTDLEIDADVQAHDSYVTIDARMTKSPRMELHGRALGLFAPWFFDLFVPGTIKGITTEFLRVLTEGNGGQGLHGHFELGAKSMGAPGVVSGDVAAEIMDTFLIKLGGGMAAEGLLINAKEKNEALQLATELHDAFGRDLARFKRRVGR